MGSSSSFVEHHEFFWCFPAAIFFRTESRVPCPRELRKARPKKVQQWRNRDRWMWCQGTSWSQSKTLRKIRTARGIKSWIRVMFHPASGNWCETRAETQQHILRAATRWHSIFEHQETGARWWHINRKDEVRIPQYASLRPSILWESLQEPAGTNTRCWSSEDQCIVWGLFMSTTMKAWVHLGAKYIENFGSFQEHKLQGIAECVRHHAESDIGPSNRNSECITDFIGQLPHGRDQHSRKIRWSRGRKQRHTSTQIPSHAWERCNSILKRTKDGKTSTRRIPTVQFLQRIIWNWWRTDSVRVE